MTSSSTCLKLIQDARDGSMYAMISLALSFICFIGGLIAIGTLLHDTNLYSEGSTSLQFIWEDEILIPDLQIQNAWMSANQVGINNVQCWWGDKNTWLHGNGLVNFGKSQKIPVGQCTKPTEDSAAKQLGKYGACAQLNMQKVTFTPERPRMLCQVTTQTSDNNAYGCSPLTITPNIDVVNGLERYTFFLCNNDTFISWYPQGIAFEGDYFQFYDVNTAIHSSGFASNSYGFTLEIDSFWTPIYTIGGGPVKGVYPLAHIGGIIFILYAMHAVVMEIVSLAIPGAKSSASSINYDSM